MNRISRLFILLLFLIPTFIFAQEAAEETPPASLWKNELKGGLSLTQSQYSNWSEGGINTIAAAANLNGKFEFKGEQSSRSHTLKLAFGQVKQDTLDFRKASDVIYYMFQAAWNVGSAFKPTLLVDARSQFAPAYNYKKPSEPMISDFLAPGYFTQTAGVSYEPNSWFKTLVGVSAKQTVVRVEELRESFGVSFDETYRMEAGLNSITQVDRNIAENVNWKSQLGIFVSLMSPEDVLKGWGPDVRWDNVIAMKVNSFLNVNLEFSTLYDTDITKQLQVREVLSLGFVYNFM